MLTPVNIISRAILTFKKNPQVGGRPPRDHRVRSNLVIPRREKFFLKSCCVKKTWYEENSLNSINWNKTYEIKYIILRVKLEVIIGRIHLRE